jgi:hypothetical protein
MPEKLFLYDDIAAYLKTLTRRWADLPLRNPENYVDKNYDALKLVGAGNATGLIAISAFITSGTRSSNLMIGGKICLSIFAFGLVSFAASYFFLYHWSFQMDKARQIFGTKNGDADASFDKQIKTAAKSYAEAGRWATISIVCFCVAFLIAVIGILAL